MFSKSWFFNLDSQLREMGLDSDDKSFDEIRRTLSNPIHLSPDEFASAVSYVILASGFSQKTAKRIHKIIMQKMPANAGDLLKVFNNKNKVNAICKIWDNRQDFCDGYYACSDLESKLNYLQKLPHIGKITANHLARNGVLYGGNNELQKKIDNGKLDGDIKKCCDEMFAHLARETGFPIGYIDVVLWKALQNHLIEV